MANTHSESSEHVDNNPSSQARNATIELNMRHTLPYCIPSNIFKQAGIIDSINGWPDISYPSVENYATAFLAPRNHILEQEEILFS